MKAIFKHELRSYFSGLTGYVFGAFLLLFAGIYCMVYNLKNMLVNFEYVFGGMAFIFLIVIPILTMRVLSEEKRQKTDQLLYSLPISMTSVVIGKYLAMLVMLLIPLGIVATYPLVLSIYGNVYLPASYGSLLGFFFLGAALIAVGMFLSSITESQAVAAGLCFVVLLINYYFSSLAAYLSASAFAAFLALVVILLLLAVIFYIMTKNKIVSIGLGIVLECLLMIFYMLKGSSLEDVVPQLVENLSLFERFYAFMDGILDLRSIVYFVTVAGVFLFLCVQSLEKRRWSE